MEGFFLIKKNYNKFYKIYKKKSYMCKLFPINWNASKAKQDPSCISKGYIATFLRIDFNTMPLEYLIEIPSNFSLFK